MGGGVSGSEHGQSALSVTEVGVFLSMNKTSSWRSGRTDRSASEHGHSDVGGSASEHEQSVR